MNKYDTWEIPFLSLNLMGGTLKLIECDGQDMLTISWFDGMLIDVGYIEEDGVYHVTTAADDSLKSRNHPLAAVQVKRRCDLPQALQNKIFRCRS